MSTASALLHRHPTDAPCRPGRHVATFAAAAVGAGAARAVTTTYVPVLLDRIKDAPGLIGLVMLVNAGAGFAVPLVTGVWSDRRHARGLGARMPFVVGGSLLAAGGLIAVAFGWSSSYLALALFAAIVYVGLNAMTTAHRALVAEVCTSGEQARGTSAQELALLAGGLVGLAAGGLLGGMALWAPFAAIAVLLPLTTAPTALRVSEPHTPERDPADGRAFGHYVRAATRPGVRTLLLAEWLWVMGYAALPAFFVLYAQKVLDLSLAHASVMLAAFGLVTAAAIYVAGRVKRRELFRPLLLLGIALMGGGMLAVPLTTDLLATTPALIAAAAGFGIVSSLSFPVLSAMIPEGEAGSYTALFFSVRAIASAIALPLAGALIAVTDSYRLLFVFGGTVTLLGLVVLAASGLLRHLAPSPWALRWTAALALLYAAVLATGELVVNTGLHRLDERGYRWLNGFGPGPKALFDVLEVPARNYAVLGTIVLVGALVARFSLRRLIALEFVSVAISVALLRGIYLVFDRDRPSEVFDRSQITLAYGRSWASIESFPSGHMAVITAVAAAAWLAIPRLRWILLAYVALNAVTRVVFGAHFPIDVLAGMTIGYSSALAGRSLLAHVTKRRHTAGTLRPETGRPRHVVAVMPSHNDIPSRDLVARVLESVDGLTIVDDGSGVETARALDHIAADFGVQLVRLPENRGKGAALRVGIDAVLAADDPPDAVLVIDADGQHPPEAIPSLIEAGSTAELVIGDRFGDLTAMPRARRLANRTSQILLGLTTGRRVRDTQSGMRLLRGRALALPMPGNGYEAETRHLKALLTLDVEVSWVPIPTIYQGEESGFRSIRDSVRVVAALVGPAARSA